MMIHRRKFLAMFATCQLVVAGGLGNVSRKSFQFGKVSYRYAVFTPTPYSEGRLLPVLLLIHGAGGRGLDMLELWQQFANEKGILLVAPDFPLDAKFEEIVPELFPALMETVRQERKFDSRRVYVFGYSAGGYVTFDAATLASEYFAAAGVFAAIIAPEYDEIVKRAKRKTPVALYIGDHDQFFRLSQARRTRDLLLANDFPVHYVELPNQDHNYAAASRQVNPDVWNFMRASTLP